MAQNSTWSVLRLVLLGAILARVGLVLSVNADLNEDFETLKAAHEQQYSRLVTPFEKIYLSRLQRLETLYINQQLYEEAQRCRDERLKVEASIKASPSKDAAAEIIFTSSEASLRGGVKLTGEWIDGWTQGSAIGWKLPGLQKGGYEVFLVYSGVAAPVEVKLQEASFFLLGGLQRANEETRMSLGLLRISETNAPLELSLLPPFTSTSLRVKALILVPQWP